MCRSRARGETNNDGSANTQLRLGGTARAAAAATALRCALSHIRTKSRFRIAVVRKSDRPRAADESSRWSQINRLGRAARRSF